MDALTKLASAKVVINNRAIIQETLQVPCISKIMNIEEKELCITLIITFLKWGKLSENKN